MGFGMKRTATAIALVLALSGAASPTWAADPEPKSYAEVTEGLTRQEGLLPVFVDQAGGKVLVQLPAPGADGVMTRVIHHTALRTGVGSAVTGLDRAQIGATNILAFRRIGKRVIAEFENPKYEAPAGSPEEQAAARDAFVGSTVWAGDVVATAPDGSVLVDLSGFLTRDAMGIVETLKATGQGSLKAMSDLTLVDPAATRDFPENLEMEARLTFAVDGPGDQLRMIAPEPRLATFTVHHSFIKLPDDHYRPRDFDPRTGAFSTSLTDYSAPLNAPLVYRLAHRFRLEKTDPTAARSPVKTPIVFYVDRAAPEPVRTALIEGGRWWNQAFEAAGFIDAFRVEVLPDGVSPARRALQRRQLGAPPDARLVVRPRGRRSAHRRDRQGLCPAGFATHPPGPDDLRGLEGAAATGKGGSMTRSRSRWLACASWRPTRSATIGLQHNFAASTYGGRASVMDYPVPQIAVTADNGLDFSDAYAVGMGAWDDFAIDWLYSDADKATLEAKAEAGSARLRFANDADARVGGDAQPWGSLWDNGEDPVAELDHILKIRRIALDGFGLRNLPAGAAVNDLRRRLVPIYLYHRYQVDAVSKLVGGVDYGYPVAGAGQEAATPVPADTQRAALAALARTLNPAELDLPEPLLALLAAQQSGDGDPQNDIEVFKGQDGRAFDPGVAADVAADVTLDALFAPQRINRIADAGRRDPANLGLGETIDVIVTAAFAPAEGRLAEPARRVQAQTVLTLAGLLRGDDLSSTSTAIIDDRLQALAVKLKASRAADPVQRAHDRWLGALIGDRERLDQLLEGKHHAPATPPGSPIGAEEGWHDNDA
jgi:hypothetical protein